LATFGLPTRRSNGARFVQVGSIPEVSQRVEVDDDELAAGG